MTSTSTPESAVGRRKPGEEPRQGKRFTLPPDVIKALEERSAESDVPESRLVERALRLLLGMDKDK